MEKQTYLLGQKRHINIDDDLLEPATKRLRTGIATAADSSLAAFDEF